MARSSAGTARSNRIACGRTCHCRPTKRDASVERFVEHYNHVRLHSAIGYVTPADKLAGREKVIFAERDRKLEAARNP